MHLPHRRPLSRLTRVGLALLIPALVATYLIDHRYLPETTTVSLLQGLCFGLAITSILIGMRRSCSAVPSAVE